jgi:hypothetical protein
MQQSGRNKGKKYVKLTGNEIATPEAERKAKRFIDWYGAMYITIARSIRDHDQEIATDTMLQMYNDILYKDARVKNYRAYFISAYHTTKLKRTIAEGKRRALHVSLDAPIEGEQDQTIGEMIPAPDYDYETYEACIEQVHAEVLGYVRANYEPMEISIFEIYVGLQPNVSYSTMGAMLGISANRIYLIISAIKRDLQLNYTERRKYLLSKL